MNLGDGLKKIHEKLKKSVEKTRIQGNQNICDFRN